MFDPRHPADDFVLSEALERLATFRSWDDERLAELQRAVVAHRPRAPRRALPWRRLGRGRAARLQRVASVYTPESVAEALAVLELSERKVLVLRFAFDWPVDMIADELGATPRAVAALLRSALDRLIAVVEGDGEPGRRRLAALAPGTGRLARAGGVLAATSAAALVPLVLAIGPRVPLPEALAAPPPDATRLEPAPARSVRVSAAKAEPDLVASAAGTPDHDAAAGRRVEVRVRRRTPGGSLVDVDQGYVFYLVPESKRHRRRAEIHGGVAGLQLAPRERGVVRNVVGDGAWTPVLEGGVVVAPAEPREGAPLPELVVGDAPPTRLDVVDARGGRPLDDVLVLPHPFGAVPALSRPGGRAEHLVPCVEGAASPVTLGGEIGPRSAWIVDAPGCWSVPFVRPTWIRARGHAWALVWIEVGRGAPRTVRLRDGAGALDVALPLAPDGRRERTVVLRGARRGRPLLGRVTTTEDRVLLDGVPGGSYLVSVADGGPRSGGRGVPVDVAAGETVEVRLPASRPAAALASEPVGPVAASLRIEFDDDYPYEEVRGWFEPVGPRGEPPAAAERTEVRLATPGGRRAGDRVELPLGDVLPGAYELHLGDVDFARRFDVRAGAVDERVDVRLAERLRLDVRVRPAQRALRGGTLVLRGVAEHGPTPRLRDVELGEGQLGAGVPLPAGPVDVELVAPGFQRVTRRVDLTRDGQLLELEAELAPLLVVRMEEDGVPVPFGYEVPLRVVLPDGERRPPIYVGMRAEFPLEEPGRIRVEAGGGPDDPAEVHVVDVADGEWAELVLRR